jgi:hypothetical protein
MADSVSLLAPLIYWTCERERVRKRREAGESPPWSEDELFQRFRFCNANVQDDHVSRVIYDRVAQPYADHPGLIVALTVCRFTNDPSVIETARDCLVPFDAPRFLDIMTERAARGEPLERRAYMIPGGVKGEIKAVSLTRDLFTPLAAAEHVRPKPGDTCETVFERLRRTRGLVVLDHVIGKHLYIDYAVALDPAGHVKRVDILQYRESYGGEVREASWLAQFVGKGSGNALNRISATYRVPLEGRPPGDSDRAASFPPNAGNPAALDLR